MLYCAKLRESIIEDSSSIQRIALAFPALELLDGKSSANSTSPRLALADRDASPLVEPASSSTAIVSPIIPTDSERKIACTAHVYQFKRTRFERPVRIDCGRAGTASQYRSGAETKFRRRVCRHRQHICVESSTRRGGSMSVATKMFGDGTRGIPYPASPVVSRTDRLVSGFPTCRPLTFKRL